MIKILLVFRGAIRNSISEILETIKITKNNFINYDIDTWLSTWESIEQKYMYGGNDYLYKYDEVLLREKLETEIEKFVINSNLNIDEVVKCNNNSPPLFMFNIKYIQQELKNIENINYTHIIITRNDLKINIKNIHNYLNENTYVPPAYWLHGNQWILSNDHYIIMPISKFLNTELENISDKIKSSWNNEELNRKIFSPDKEIKNEDIILYEINGNLKFKK